MATDKKISELPAATGIDATDISVLVSNGVDYRFSISQLLQYFTTNFSSGSSITFGTVLPQNNTGKNGDVFIKTTTGQFAQKISGTWVVIYTLPPGNATDGALLFGTGVPGVIIGKNADSYIDTITGIFYLKSSNVWSQVFSMQTGPQGAKGNKGDNGDPGLNGKTILSGVTNPSNILGIDGDFYINTNNLKFFGPKTIGVWAEGINIVGTDGVAGPIGLTGATGGTGPIGPGVAPGGLAKQILKKDSDDDFDTSWADNSFIDISGSATDNVSLNYALNTKVEKVTGYSLSQNNFTDSEKNKLATLSEHFKGKYTSLTALQTANPIGILGDYATVDAGIGSDTQLYMWDGDDSVWVLSSDSVIPDATESSSGLVELATVAEALARTDDQRVMTALKTIALILDEKKKVNYQINPVSLNEVSILMENAGQVNSVLISGAASTKLKIGLGGTYPLGSQTYPFVYAAGDRVFITYNYTDLSNASCNIKLKCQDN